MSITNYLLAKGFEITRNRANSCPFCEFEGKVLTISPNDETYYCHVCNAKGNLATLKTHYNDQDNPNLKSFKEIVGKKEYKKPPADQAEVYHKALLENSVAIDYLMKRGLKAATIKYFKLGHLKEKNDEWITIPYYEDGNLVNFKFRSLPPGKKFKTIADAKSILFNQDALNNGKEVVITEGEMDAIMVWQSGIKNVVSVTNGADSFQTSWIDMLQDKEKIYLWYDNDDAGRKGRNKVIERLGIERCWVIEEEGIKDANEYFMCNEKYDLTQAKQIPIDNILHFWDSVFKIFEHEQEITSEIQTPWKNVDKLLGVIQAGDLITLSAVPKTGKTTMALNIATYNALKGLPVLVYCLEMRPERLAKKVIESEGMLSKDNFSREKALKVAERIYEMPLYFGYNYKNIEPEIVFQTIRAAVKRFGLKLVIFDNLHYMVRSLAHVTAEVGKITRDFKLIAEEMRIPLILIAQPRKIEDGTIMTMNDLKDSSSIGADSDQVVILWRSKTKSNPKDDQSQKTSFKPETLVRVDASRYTPGGDTMLYFKGEYSKFTLLERNRDAN